MRDEKELEAMKHNTDKVLSEYFAKEFPFLAGPISSPQERIEKLSIIFEGIIGKGGAKRS